jgi:hypothetical protein
MADANIEPWNGVAVQPTAQLFCSWHKIKKPHLPRPVTTVHVELDSGRFSNKKKQKKSLHWVEQGEDCRANPDKVAQTAWLCGQRLLIWYIRH